MSLRYQLRSEAGSASSSAALGAGWTVAGSGEAPVCLWAVEAGRPR